MIKARLSSSHRTTAIPSHFGHNSSRRQKKGSHALRGRHHMCHAFRGVMRRSRTRMRTTACWRPQAAAALPADCMQLQVVLLLLVTLLLGSPQQVLGVGSSKVACDYSNRLCQWNATYAFGATVLGDLAFFHGGLYSNDATTPVNGSYLEVMDLRTMSPYLIQIEPNRLLNSSRYNHQLVTWDNQLLAVGGNMDDSNGKSAKVVSVIALDLNTRTWSSIKNLTPPTSKDGTEDNYMFEAATVSGDYLLTAFQVISGSGEDTGRKYLSLDLTTQEVDGTFDLFDGPLMLDWPLVAILSLTDDGSPPHLVMQAKREMPSATNKAITWYVIDSERKVEVRSFSANTKLTRLSGGSSSGGKVLALNILQIRGKPHLVMLANTLAAVKGSTRPQSVTVVTVNELTVTGSGNSRSVSLQLTHVLLTPPLGVELADVHSADLPLFGNVSLLTGGPAGGAGAERVLHLLPYVGRADLVSTLSAMNANIQRAPGGFIIRGSGMADQVCQPGATWQPFVLKAVFDNSMSAPPDVVAVSNYTWCSTRSQQQAAAQIVNDGKSQETNTKLYKVDSKEGAQLLLVNYQTMLLGGGLLVEPERKLPLMAAFINLRNSTVRNFTVKPDASYLYPKGQASCLTQLDGRPVYVETGGSAYTAEGAVGSDKFQKGAFVMDAAPSNPQHALVAAGGGDVAPATTQGAMACSPDGKLFLFGGLSGKLPATPQQPGVLSAIWTPTNTLHVLKLSGSPSKPQVSKEAEVAVSQQQGPSPRSGAALAYLPSSVVSSSLGMQQGALLLYGGSTLNATSMSQYDLGKSEAQQAAGLRTTTWDNTTWLFDLAANKWQVLATQGQPPPPLMYHSMTAQGQQVVMFGGQTLNAASSKVTLSTMLYVLDFAGSPPRWRQAAIRLNNQGAYQNDWPNTGVAMVPELGAVALKHRSAVNLAPIPQSLTFSGDGGRILSTWGLNTLNTTAGDWLRLAPSQPQLTVRQPVLLAADVMLSGVVTSADNNGSGSSKPGAGRHLLQQQGGGGKRLALQCDGQAGSAVSIRSGGAQLSDLSISGCSESAVTVLTDATGAYTTPALLTNITLSGNKGAVGVGGTTDTHKGSVVHVGPSAAAHLQGVDINSNSAGGSLGVVYAAARSSLTLVNCSVSRNNGTAVVFAGSNLTISGSNFTDNAAVAAGSGAPASAAASTAKAGGALRLLCYEPGPGGYDSVTSISTTRFSGNRGVEGGAVYAGPGTTLRLLSVVAFDANSGYEGGAVFADRDSCLDQIFNTTFSLNTAQERGGAIKMRNPSCANITWAGGRFSSNSAADGGAVYASELTMRIINASATLFEHNRATRPFTSRRSGSSTGGAGGALYLGLWGSTVLLHNSTFFNNSAYHLGGAVHALAIDNSSITLDRVNATSNAASWDSLSDELLAGMLRSEGGALSVDGSIATITITHSHMADNMAGRGGAVSANSEQGVVSINTTTFNSNTALTAGGAVAVTERKAVTITNTTFANNTLWWKELAAGGGLYCFLCTSVNITSSNFTANRAAYGGGAAVLQPWQDSLIFNTSFIDNVALPDPSSSLLDGGDQTADRRRRSRSLLLAAPYSQMSGSRAVNPARMGGQAAAVAILGPLAANVTGDNGLYTGGGGLYVSLSSGTSTIRQCAFVRNSAYNGGGFLARTDSCHAPEAVTVSANNSNVSSRNSSCRLQLSEVSVRNNSARAAGGVLITNIRPEVVVLLNCSSGSALRRDTLPCLEAHNALTHQLTGWSSSPSAGRSLLQQQQQSGDASAAAGSGGDPGANTAVSGYGNFLLTSAAGVRCQNMVRRGAAGDTEEALWLDDDCAQPIMAPPGQPFGRSFVLLDGLGDPISSGIYDAHMPMAASVEATRPAAVPYRILGNTTQAQNGTARFTGLTVNGKPGDTVTLRFHTQNGLAVTRQVILRRCQAGEATDNSASTANELSYSCRACLSPLFSMYPAATTCSQCASLPANSWSVCNGPAVVPADGFFQSHPRSPVLTPCISSLACRRNDAVRRQMADWSYMNANLTTAQLMNTALLAPYMDRMCTHGYTGPLCGACQPDHGHSGQTCVHCLPRPVNSFFYFLVCCFMMVVPIAQMVLQTKSVSRNNTLVAQQGALPPAAAGAVGGGSNWQQWASGANPPSLQHRHSSTSSASGGGWRAPGLPTLQETNNGPAGQQQQQPAGAAADEEMDSVGERAGAAAAAAMRKDGGDVELAQLQHHRQQQQQQHSGLAATAALSASDIEAFRRRDQGQQDGVAGRHSSADSMASPFSEPSAIAGAMASQHEFIRPANGSASSSVAPTLPDLPSHALAHGPGRGPGFAAGAGGAHSLSTGGSNRSVRLIQRLFDTSSLDYADAQPWGWGGPQQHSSSMPAHVSSSATGAAAGRRALYRSGSNGVEGSAAHRGPSNTSVDDTPADAVPGGSADGPAAAAAATAPPGSWPATAVAGVGGMLQQAGSAQVMLKRMSGAPLVHRRSYKFYHADVLSMLVNYMQLLGLLRLVRINWAAQLRQLLVYLDFTSGASTWISLECSLSDDDGSSSLPRSVRRSIVVLLWPLGALLVLAAFWLAVAWGLRNRPWARRRLFFRKWLLQHAVMCVVILLYFLYTTTTRELISLFSCQQVDDPARLPIEAAAGMSRSMENPAYSEALLALPYQSSSWTQGYWTSDTRVRCSSPVHLGLVIGLGIPGVLLFGLGLPIGLWVMLSRINKQTLADGRCRLEDPEVELQFGAVYEKYRYSCYYWECVILLEAFLLTLLLVLLQTQNNAALQVLVAMAVIFLEAVLHITFQPYACRMLDTLRRLAVYGLMSTLFMLMLVTLASSQDQERLLSACMVIVALINLAIIGVHLWACGREVRRWLLWTAGKGPQDKLTWQDMLASLPDSVKEYMHGCRLPGRRGSGGVGGGSSGGRNWFHLGRRGRASYSTPPIKQDGGAGAAGGVHGNGPPEESADGVQGAGQQNGGATAAEAGGGAGMVASSTTTNPRQQTGPPVEVAPRREGVVVVINPGGPPQFSPASSASAETGAQQPPPAQSSQQQRQQQQQQPASPTGRGQWVSWQAAAGSQTLG